MKVSYITSYDDNYKSFTQFNYEKNKNKLKNFKLKDFDLNDENQLFEILSLVDICNYEVDLNHLKYEIDYYLKSIDLIALKNNFQITYYYQYSNDYINQILQKYEKEFRIVKNLKFQTLSFELIYDDLFVYEDCIGNVYFSFDNDEDNIICNQCGDYDTKLGQVNTSHELIDLLKKHNYSENMINQLHTEYYTWFNKNEV